MKQLKRRTLFVLCFVGIMVVLSGVFCVRLVLHGREWASSSVNWNAYSSGKLAQGSIYDRNGVLLYDCETQTYGDSRLLRTSTLHLVGDRQGNIGGGAKRLFSDKLVGYNPITGLNKKGNKLYLSVNANLNQTAYEALDGRAGTVAVYNYQTGEILCLVSAPSFDPTDDKQVQAVADGDSRYEGAYINRFFSSTYTPGSIFKVITAAAALEHLDTGSFSFHCTGSYEINGSKVTCPKKHGDLDFGTALAKSCNGAFAQLALELNGTVLEEYARKAGLLDSMTISGYPTAAGSFEAAAPGTLDLGWSGVGQFHDQVCPATMLTLMGCIAGGGNAATPRLDHKITSPTGLPVGLDRSAESSIGWKEETCQTLRKMMRDNVLQTYGQEQFGSLPVCAKSGTAEVGSGQEPHAWFVGFVDEPEHPYAFVVVVEHGGWGSSTAGRIAASVLKQLDQED